MLLRELLEGMDDNDHAEALRDTGFWGKAGAGALFFARDTGRFLIGHRSAHVEQPGTWGTFGGAIDSGEDPVAAVKREAHEETGYQGAVDVHPLLVFRKDNFRYSNFLLVVDREFTPHLNWENQGFRWVKWGQWPKPLHFGMVSLLNDAESVATMRRLAQISLPVTEARNVAFAPVVVQAYRDGGCYYFALALHRLTGAAILELCNAVAGSDISGGGHAVVQLADGDVADAAGRHSKRAVLAEFGANIIRPVSAQAIIATLADDEEVEDNENKAGAGGSELSGAALHEVRKAERLIRSHPGFLSALGLRIK